MEVISFIKIKKFIVNKLHEYSIDTIYNKTHPWYDVLYELYNKEKQVINRYQKPELKLRETRFREDNEWIEKEKYNILKGSLILNNEYVINIIQKHFIIKYFITENTLIKYFIRYSFRQHQKNKLIQEILKNLKPLIFHPFENINEIKNTFIEIKNKRISIKINNDAYQINEIVDWDKLINYISTQNFKTNSFKYWIEYNSNLLTNIETVKKDKIKHLNNKLSEIKANIDNSLKLQKSIKNKINRNIKDLELLEDELLNKLPKLKEENKKNIEEHNKEIQYISGLCKNDFYAKRIKELKNITSSIPKETKEYEIKLKEKKKQKQKKNDELKNELIIISEKIIDFNKKLNELKTEIKKISLYKHEYSLSEELSAKQDIIEFLFKEDQVKNNIFEEAYKYSFDNIEYNIIKNELLSLLNDKIEKILVLEREKFNVPSVINSENVYDSNIAASFISLRNALQTKNYLLTNKGIIHLSLGNGIIAEIKVRNNINELKPLIAEIRDNNYNSNVSYIFSGYTKSGFILNLGLYIISKKLIFEITYSSNSLLLSGINNFINVQNISDSKKRDEEIEDKMYD